MDTSLSLRKRLKWHLGVFAAIVATLPVLLLPAPVAVALGGAAGSLAFRLLGKVRRNTVTNIRNALPALQSMEGWDPAAGTPEEIARRTFVNLGRTAVEIIKLCYGQGQGLVEGTELRGMEHYLRAKERGKGVIFITGHCDNWEIVAHAFGTHSDGMAVVARRQKYEPLTRLLERLRNRHGNSVIYADGAARQIFFRLRKNGAIGLLMDQAVHPSEGELVEFLGKKAWTTTMPALLAAKTGAALVPGFGRREGNRHVLEFFPEIAPDPAGDPIATTRLLNRAIEAYIVRHPDQWLWVYNRWKRVPAEQ
ncbi:lysophospholipid acyltransferase family protein [Geobacter sulfurreducens]|uniref:Lipid A biosynthesis acyltransferase n=1 Tax=Geobacter sulfurreducens (strain ATCC 51573 / DSM 12127 / PCA) TaxID=243231 RepID=Q746U8_GEOSL|nr:lysophospholipid acyltransferase family protein [Geobacter sulfurreducens]AAR36810.1 lipid A biosynthesis acyltransferase [Geobacter sulfurreducens PCA]ADI86176.1 lipid A biosynthesis acyltransferase [Geobacter sulfurreducens KN400]AJY69671.1 lipid A biosynthesis acyltransferase [Geobacter sulfurreducens]QVW35229.1 lysophospholipid acyltransferase family protein [Geobacter sulfurreducens]UAC04066.1 lysophospholipid acyltransferase family protein [Geobacter sulfurreducens]